MSSVTRTHKILKGARAGEYGPCDASKRSCPNGGEDIHFYVETLEDLDILNELSLKRDLEPLSSREASVYQRLQKFDRISKLVVSNNHLDRLEVAIQEKEIPRKLRMRLLEDDNAMVLNELLYREDLTEEEKNLINDRDATRKHKIGSLQRAYEDLFPNGDETDQQGKNRSLAGYYFENVSNFKSGEKSRSFAKLRYDLIRDKNTPPDVLDDFVLRSMNNKNGVIYDTEIKAIAEHPNVHPKTLTRISKWKRSNTYEASVYQTVLNNKKTPAKAIDNIVSESIKYRGKYTYDPYGFDQDYQKYVSVLTKVIDHPNTSRKSLKLISRVANPEVSMAAKKKLETM